MSIKLWEASKKTKKKSKLFAFEKFISLKTKKNFHNNYKKIHNWSVKNAPDFWSLFWDFSKIIGLKTSKKFKKSKIFYKNSFLPKSKLNFGENLLQRNDKKKAVTFISENGFRETKNWNDLYSNVSKIYNFLKKIKIKKSDRVVAYMPNTTETVEAFIASVSLGAIWSSCSPDFGSRGVVERFLQINPKIIFITKEYFYNGKRINLLDRLAEIVKNIPSIKYVVVCNYPGQKEKVKYFGLNKVKIIKWPDIMKLSPSNIKFSKFDFDHELAILFSSGTTGKPKCICHRNG